MANKMLIDATHPEETRVVVLRGNRVEEFDFETAHRKQLRGNIYLAKVTRVEPSLQAAFVDYGGNRHGFLAFSEIHPDYYQIPVADRQALIDDDARAARESDAEDDQRGRNRRRPRRGERAHARPDETIQSDALVAEELAREAAEIPAGEDVMDDPLPDQQAEPLQPEIGGRFRDRRPPVGETENPPTAGESGTVVEPPQTESTEDIHGSEPAEAASPVEAGPPAEDGGPHEAGTNGNGRGGNGDDEEEEIVESVGGSDALEEVPDRAPRYRRQYKIQEVIKRRQVMLVQVVKEERGTKGAALTTYLSLAGRYCVLMPNTARGGGISRKITSADDRKQAARDRRGARSAGGHGRDPAHRRRRPHQGRGQARLRIPAAAVGEGARPDAASRPRRRWSTRKARWSSARSATSTARTSTRSSSPAKTATATPRTSCACSCRAMRRT